jgi:hypothetical protein
MSRNYKFQNLDGVYFIDFAVVQFPVAYVNK